MRHRKHRDTNGGVELNLAAMLDMAFQLLAFFILTFRPAPIEAQLALHLPIPATAATGDPENKRVDPPEEPVIAGNENTLVISIHSEPDGNVKKVSLGFGTSFTGPATAANLLKLERQLRETFEIAHTSYEQVLVRVAPGLKYQELMKVLDVCTKQKTSDGKQVHKISFVELVVPPAK